MSAGENVLAAALAAGIPLPHSCRAGRCATCKARLLSGEIEYPAGKLPPGIVASEAARGDVLLCQARPRSALVIETRGAMASLPPGAEATLESIEALPLGALRLQLRFTARAIDVAAGQFVELCSPAGHCERLAVIGAAGPLITLECAPGGDDLFAWLDSQAQSGSRLLLRGPFQGIR